MDLLQNLIGAITGRKQTPPNPYPNVAPDVQQQIMAGQAINAQQKQQMLQRLNTNQPSNFNPVTATIQSLGQGAKQIGTGLANMTGVPQAAAVGMLGGAELRHNQQGIDKATNYLAGSVPQFLPVALTEAVKPFAQDVASTIVSPYANAKANQAEQYAKQELNDKTSDPAYNASVDAIAADQKTQLLNSLLGTAGVNMNTPKSTLTRKVLGAAGSAATSIGMVGSLAGGEAASSMSPEAQKLLSMLNFGGQQAAQNVAQTMQTDSPTGADYAKAAIGGFTQGAAMPLLMHGAEAAGPAIESGTKALTDTLSNVGNAEAERQTGLKSPNVVNDNEAGTLRDFADYKTGAYKPDADTLNQLHMQARNAAQTAGIDITSGSPASVTDRIYNYLSQRGQFLDTRKSVLQGGYVRLPGADNPDNTSTPPINRTQLTGHMLDVPNSELQDAMNSKAFADVFGVSHGEARAALEDLRKQREAAGKRRGPQAKRQIPERPAEVNTALNPVKRNFAKVAAGDYEKARTNAQEASAGVELRGRQAFNAIPEDMTTSKLARLAQGIDKPANAAEEAAVQRYRDLTNNVHATSQALGGNTNYVKNYFRGEWDLSDPAMQAKFDKLVTSKYGKDYDPSKFAGLDRQPKVFDTIAEGEAAGFHLKNQLARDEIADYTRGSAYALKNQALAKSIEQADVGETDKPITVDLGNGKTLKVSVKAAQQMLPYERLKQLGWLGKSYDAINKRAKGTLLSISEFHPINISVMKAGPGLALAGHPLNALKGAYGTFRGQVGSDFADRTIQKTLTDQLPAFTDKGETTMSPADIGAKIGMPMLQHSDFAPAGKLQLGKSGIGERTIFEKSMPIMQDQVLRSIAADLYKKGVSLDSPEARRAGEVGYKMMGAINNEVKNIDPNAGRRWSRVLLANQFTRAKWSLMKDAFTQPLGSVAGKYARRSVAGNYAMQVAMIAGMGYLVHQKSDDIRDMLIRALIDPAIPTPWKDNKGNTMDMRLPASYNSELLGLFFNIGRGADGHLDVQFKPQNIIPNLENYGRYRLAEIPSDILKVATNQNFANKPLYDPNAPLGTQAAQAATTLTANTLPIGLQGLTQTSFVKKHLPGPIKQVLDAETPGSNPVVKSALSSFGLTPRTDTTVGKGQQTTQYFDALDQAKAGLNRQEQDALDMVTGSKKNPVTGQYEIAPVPDDSRAKATALLQNPKVIDHLMQMNQSLAGQGQQVDPLWLQSKDHITAYYQYQAMPPGGPDRTNWMNQNQDWYNQLSQARNQYFATLPPGDPNKPKSPIQYPTATADVQNMEDQFFASTPQQQQQLIQQHPELLQQFAAQHDYTNAVRSAEGYQPLQGAPTPSQRVQSLLNAASASTDKSTRAKIYGDPEVAAYMQASNAYNLSKNAALAQLQGNQLNQKALKSAYQIGSYDTVKNPDGTYALANPILQPNGTYMPSGAMAGATMMGGAGSSPFGQNLGVPGMKHFLVPRPKKTFSTTLHLAKKGAKLGGSIGVVKKSAVKAANSKRPLPVRSGSSGLQLSKRKVKV